MGGLPHSRGKYGGVHSETKPGSPIIPALGTETREKLQVKDQPGLPST